MKAAGHKKEDEASRANQQSSMTASSKTTHQSQFKRSSNPQPDILSEEDHSNGTKGGCVTFRDEIFQQKLDSEMKSKKKPLPAKERQEMTPGGRRNRANSIFHIGRSDYEPFKPSLFLLDMDNSYGKKYADDDELSTGYGCDIESSQRKEGNCLSFENTLDTDKLRDQPRLSELKRGGEKSNELPILESATEKEASNLCSREDHKTSTPSNKRKILVEPEFTFQPKILQKSKLTKEKSMDRLTRVPHKPTTSADRSVSRTKPSQNETSNNANNSCRDQSQHHQRADMLHFYAEMKNLKKKSENRYEDYLDILGQIKSEMEIDEIEGSKCRDPRKTDKHRQPQNTEAAQRKRTNGLGKEAGTENIRFHESKENQRKEANLSKALNTKFQKLFDNYLKSSEKACNPRIDLKKLEGLNKGNNLVDDPDQELSERINAQLYKVYEMEARGKMLKFV